ncbi:hypothetical protein V6N13_002330 [Hibiscus sabdariffa]|uniref:DDT domain-containing protein n=1 Tax=Hibiscus sabdariffa TaxID=183260 RepID=A0ABR2C2U5_9ROSI
MDVDRGKTTLGATVPVEGKESRNESVLILEDLSTELEVAKLRSRWELASVLNFLIVFEPVIGSDLKLTAEEIELGLIKPNASIAALHIRLLQGAPPLSKLLNDPDGWMTALCKKVTIWWRWFAEGEIPLNARNGDVISKYKELDPTSRLLLLKALCEIRADVVYHPFEFLVVFVELVIVSLSVIMFIHELFGMQSDALSYINEAMKSNKEISCFRKEKIGANGNVSYWYDGNTVLGYRLYREVKGIEPQSKAKGKACLTLETVCSHWETLAVDFKEFREVVDTLLASKTAAEVAIGKIINDDVIPVVGKFQKRKERTLNQKKREEMLLSGLRSSSSTGITHTCRNRRPVNYTFDEYDRAIDEAIEVTKRRKTNEEQSQGQKLPSQTLASNGGSVPKDTVQMGKQTPIWF